jgi:hypothetical protein
VPPLFVPFQRTRAKKHRAYSKLTSRNATARHYGGIAARGRFPDITDFLLDSRTGTFYGMTTLAELILCFKFLDIE